MIPISEKKNVLRRLLYAIGGFDGAERLNSVECYHPENDEWSEVSPMQDCRSGAGVANLGQYIYVIGGYSGRSQMTTVERYDTERDSWEYVSPLPTARSALSVTVLDGKLYAMGKFAENSRLNFFAFDGWTRTTSKITLHTIDYFISNENKGKTKFFQVASMETHSSILSRFSIPRRTGGRKGCR